MRVVGLAIFGVIVFAQVSVGYAESIRCAGRVEFSRTLSLAGKQLPLLGCELYRYWIWDVYSAALYGPDSWKENRQFRTDSPSELVLQYHRDISAEELSESALVFLQKQNQEVPSSIRKDAEKVHAAYEDVSSGDRYSLRYVPEEGTSLIRNGKTMVTIPGEEFADYYFRIWLDAKKPIDLDVRNSLFGKQN